MRLFWFVAGGAVGGYFGYRLGRRMAESGRNELPGIRDIFSNPASGVLPAGCACGTIQRPTAPAGYPVDEFVRPAG